MKPSISIIGTGALGSTLGRALFRCGYPLKSLFNRTGNRAKKLVEELGLGGVRYNTFPATGDELGELVFLTVSDSAIGEVAEKLSDRIGDRSGFTVAHCSGNEASGILEVLKQKNGAETAAFHPLQTFHEESGPDAFRDIYITLEGGEKAVQLLSGVAEDLDAAVLPIEPDAKPYLHAAAVVASNYLVTLLETAGRISELGGIDPLEARRALMPLAETALENSAGSDLASVLSGPIARGDTATVCKHLKILEHNPRLLSLYKTVGLGTLELAERKGSISVENLEELNTLLSP